jgi:hypothetical protein
MPYLVARRSEIKSGHIMITDLFPNQSLANPTIDPKPQGPFYIKPAIFGSSFGETPNLISNGQEVIVESNAFGLVAYLLRHVEDGTGASLTVSEAVEIANAVKVLVRSGAVINAVALNTAATAGGLVTDFDGNGTTSNGEVDHVLRILSGESYVLSKGSKIQDGQGNFVPVIADAGFQGDVRRLVNKDASWKISLAQGSLRGLVSATENEFAGGTSTDPLLTIYNNDGTLYPV